MHDSPYQNLIAGPDWGNQHLHDHQYMRRLEFARDNGCNTVILTGDGEPLSNRHFLNAFAKFNWAMRSSFRWVEVQTSGVFLDSRMLSFLKGTVGVTTISLSLSSLDTVVNAEINETPNKLAVIIMSLCDEIKRMDFNLRLSLNLNDVFNDYTPKYVFEYLKELGADQVTFRTLYNSNTKCPQNEWIASHKYSKLKDLTKYITDNGRRLERLPFGAMRYSVNGISTVVDDDCMSTETKDTVKYLILRPNCKLYTKWDDEGSLLF
jgi:sulfatase maturation enzyme AslB (radical SAM superfamily)